MIIRKYAGIFIMFASLAEEYGSTTCFVINRAHQNPISILSSKRSSSDSGQSNKQTKQHNKNLIKEANIYSNNKRMRKSEIDDLVRGIGLLPAQLQSKTNKMINQSNGKKQTHTKKIKDQYKDHTSVIVPRISLQEQLDYARNGHTVLRSFIPPQTIEKVESEIVSFATSHALVAWKQKVEVQLADSSYDYHRQNSQSIASSLESIEACQDMLESFGIETGDLPFLQYFNTWRAMDSDTPTIRQLCLSPYLAQAASILMDTPTVRLYQDSLFHKRAGDGWTPWHSDARMTPFDTSKMITFWIPLQNVPTPENGGTGLYFVNCSQSDFALPYWNGAEGKEYERLEERYGSESITHHMPLAIGDVTAHNGWTLHCADGAELMEEGEERYALSITFVDGNAEVREDALLKDNKKELERSKGDMEDVLSFRSWVKEVEPRANFRHELVPIVWPLEERDE